MTPLELLVVCAAAAALVCMIFQPWPLGDPVVYSGDTFQHLALVDSADLTGSTGRTSQLAAPHGMHWSVFPTGSERLQLAALSALRSVTGDPIVAMNLFVVLALVATAAVAHTVLRWIGCRPVVAGAAACLFAVSPAALHRLNVGHLFLFALYPIPLGVYAVMWSTRRAGPRSLRPSSWAPGRWIPWRTWVFPVLSVAVIGVSSGYNAVFTALLLVGVGAVVAVRSADLRRLVAPVLLAGVLAAVTLISLAPDLLSRPDDAASTALVRSVGDSDTYGLRVAQMVLPQVNHPAPTLASWGERGLGTPAPADGAVVLGTAGTLGLVLMGAVALRRTGRPRDRTDRTVTALAAVAGCTIAIATTGGGGFVAATLGLSQVRAWSRMSPFVFFCAFAALGLLVQRRLGTARRFPAAVALLAVVALVDQGMVRPEPVPTTAAAHEDAALVEELTGALGEGALIAQLPAVSFPDDLGADRLLAPSVHAGDRLRFTAGAFRGGDGDWQQSWLHEGPERVAMAAAAMGAEGLLVQRSHRLVPDAPELDRELSRATGVEPRLSSGSTWSWFDLGPLRRQMVASHGRAAVEAAGRAVTRPIAVTYEGTVGMGYHEDRPAAYLGSRGAVVLRSDEGEPAPVTVTMRLVAADGAAVRVIAGEQVRRVTPGRGGARITFDDLELTGTRTSLRVEVDGGTLDTRGSEGAASVQISEVAVIDASGTLTPVLPAR